MNCKIFKSLVKISLGSIFRLNRSGNYKKKKNYQQLRRSVLGIFTGLFLSDLAEIPDVQTPVGAA